MNDCKLHSTIHVFKSSNQTQGAEGTVVQIKMVKCSNRPSNYLVCHLKVRKNHGSCTEIHETSFHTKGRDT